VLDHAKVVALAQAERLVLFEQIDERTVEITSKVSDPKLDVLLENQRREFDIEKRKALGYEIQRYLLGVTDPNATAAHVRLEYATPSGGGISWPYYKNRTSWPWFGNTFWFADAWLDKNDPSYSGRPS